MLFCQCAQTLLSHGDGLIPQDLAAASLRSISPSQGTLRGAKRAGSPSLRGCLEGLSSPCRETLFLLSVFTFFPRSVPTHSGAGRVPLHRSCGGSSQPMLRTGTEAAPCTLLPSRRKSLLSCRDSRLLLNVRLCPGGVGGISISLAWPCSLVGGLLRAEHPLFHCVLALLLYCNNFWEAGWGL